MAYEYDVIINGETVTVPSDARLSNEDAYRAAVKMQRAKQPASVPTPADQAEPEKTWPQALMSGVASAPGSVYGLGEGLVKAVASPVKTLTTLQQLSRGIVQRVLPAGLVDALGRDERGDQVYDAVAQHYIKQYGSEEGFKNAVANDPAAILADASTILTGGGSIISKIPGFASAGSKISSAGAAIEPLSATTKAVLPLVSSAVTGLSGGLTGVGSEPIKQAFRAGQEGGEASSLFTSNLRGTAQPTDIVDTARAALASIRAQASKTYRENMAGVSNDKTVLSLDDTINSLNDSFNKFAAYKGQIKNQSVAGALQSVDNKVQQWLKLDPDQFHTPEGLDQLKQSIGEILDGLPAENRTAYAAVKQVYDSVKKSVAQQAPDYAVAMDNYSKSADLLREMERALSLGNKASADTALRKLTSLMRNNVNTNYGERLRLGQMLDEASGGQVMPAVSGQALSTVMPRGIQFATGPALTSSLALTGQLPQAVMAGVVSSPRVAGEVAHGIGSVVGGIQRFGGSRAAEMTAPYRTPEVYNALYQAGLLDEKKQRQQ
jgi:hypothetical protein